VCVCAPPHSTGPVVLVPTQHLSSAQLLLLSLKLLMLQCT